MSLISVLFFHIILCPNLLDTAIQLQVFYKATPFSRLVFLGATLEI